jgi:hypothetical protein
LSLSFDSSIIFAINSASLAAALVEVVVAGLEAVIGLAAGLMVVVVVVAGLEAAGAFGAADGVCATAREAVANRVVSNRVVCLMVGRFC